MINYFEIDQESSNISIKCTLKSSDFFKTIQVKGDHIYTIWCGNFVSFSPNLILTGL